MATELSTLGAPSLIAIVMVACLAAAGCNRNRAPATAPEAALGDAARGDAGVGAQPPLPTPAGMKAPFEGRRRWREALRQG